MSRKIFFAVLFVGFVFSVFGQSVTLDEIKEYASGRQYASLKIITKYYMKDSSNAAWFDKQKESGNPSVVIERTKGQRDVIGATLLEEYRFETAFYNSANNLVICENPW
jgi:hypothetical protein